MAYLFLLISIFAAVSNNFLLHLQVFKRLNFNGFLFNICVAAIWIIIILSINAGIKGITNNTILYAVLYGTVLTGFLFFKMRALSNGPIHLTALIGSSSFILTTVFNAVYWKEKVGIMQISGIICMLAAVFMITYKADNPLENCVKAKLSLKWKLYAFLFFIFSAATGVIFKFHQYADAANTNEMMILASSAAIVFLASLYGINKLTNKKLKKNNQAEETATDISASRTKNSKLILLSIILLCGIAGCVYNRLNIYLSGVMASVIFFPVFNGGNIILSSVSGRLFFKEKLSKRQIIGIFAGLAAILLVSSFFGLVKF